MKKTTLKLLTFVFVLTVYNNLLAQYAGPGEYLILHKESGKALTVSTEQGNMILADMISQPVIDISQTFEIKELLGNDSATTYYNISCKVPEFDAVRTHGLDVVPTTTATPTTSGNNTRIHNFTLEEGQTNSYDIDTPQTTTPRIWTYNSADNNVKYVDVAAEDTKWMLYPLFPLSVSSIEGKSVFVSNPTSEKMVISGLKNKIYQIEVFNMLGKSVLTTNSQEKSSITINTSEFSSGIYIVKFSGKNSLFSKKIIKN